MLLPPPFFLVVSCVRPQLERPSTAGHHTTLTRARARETTESFFVDANCVVGRRCAMAVAAANLDIWREGWGERGDPPKRLPQTEMAERSSRRWTLPVRNRLETTDKMERIARPKEKLARGKCQWRVSPSLVPMLRNAKTQ